MGYLIQEFAVTRGDLTIRGREYKPDNSYMPAVILCHGMGSNSHSMARYADYFAGWGYCAYIFDFCGGGERIYSDGETTDMTVFTEVEDLKTVIDYVRSRAYVNNDNLTLMGASQGGLVCALTAAQLKEQISRMILFYPAFNIPDSAVTGKMNGDPFNPFDVPETFWCCNVQVGRAYATSVIGLNPYLASSAYHGPVLIVHGLDDHLVDIGYSRKAFWAYQAADGGSENYPVPHVSLIELEKAGHGFLGDNDLTAMYAVEMFMKNRVEVLHIDIHYQPKKFTRDNYKTRISYPYTGSVQGVFFRGEILPGAADDVEWAGTKRVKRCANYTIGGTDYTGQQVQIQVTNTSEGRRQSALFMTDSRALSFLNDGELLTRQDKRPQGPIVRVYAEVPGYGGR